MSRLVEIDVDSEHTYFTILIHAYKSRGYDDDRIVRELNAGKLVLHTNTTDSGYYICNPENAYNENWVVGEASCFAIHHYDDLKPWKYRSVSI